MLQLNKTCLPLVILNCIWFSCYCCQGPDRNTLSMPCTHPRHACCAGAKSNTHRHIEYKRASMRWIMGLTSGGPGHSCGFILLALQISHDIRMSLTGPQLKNTSLLTLSRMLCTIAVLGHRTSGEGTRGAHSLWRKTTQCFTPSLLSHNQWT